MRTLYENGTIDVNLIASKAKVAPTKKQTIPRLELLGATILARLQSNISKTLSLNVQEFYWVDSTATLCWIRNERLWKQYIQNRVTEIRKLSSPEMWHFCPGILNPADLPSRGISAKALCQERLWLKGPDFLFQSEDQWPTNPEKGTIDNDDDVLCEAVKGPTDVVRSLPANTSEEPKVIRANISEVIDIDRFGNLKKLLRVTVYVWRFVNALKKAKQHDKGSRDLKFLSASEIEQAEIMWLRSVQELSFAKESEFLQRNVQKSPPQYVTQFGLYTDGSRVIRCKGRLDNSSLGLGSRHPILLPSKHRFFELLIREVHEQVKHNGIRDTLTTVRERFWIIRGREAVKRISKDCVVCRKAEGLPYNYGQAPDLPSCRVSDDPPFTNVGLDFAGPLYVQDKKNELDENSNKVYVLLFTCASTRAVHLEITPSLTVKSFLSAFRRFTSRRESLTGASSIR